MSRTATLGGMVRRRVAAGGGEKKKDPRTGAVVLVVADLAKFKAAVTAERPTE